MAGAFLATLARPRWWALALSSFLLRGGILAVVLPIVILPTVATLSGLASPTVAAIAVGHPPPGMVTTYALLGAALAIWALMAIVIGAWVDLALVADAALEEDLGLAARPLGSPLARAVAARLLAHLGTAVAAGYAVIRVVVEGYAEIFSPGDSAIPLAWRIALRAPDALAVLLAAWLIGESLGGVAVRRVAVGETVLAALGQGVRGLLRRSGLATLVVTNLGVALALLPLWLAGARAWNQVRVLLVDEAAIPLATAGLVLLVATWLLGLALLAAGLAWRSAAWTAETYRVDAPALRGALSSHLSGS